MNGNWFGVNILIFRGDISSSVHVYNSKDTFLVKVQHNIALPAEAKYSINFNEQFCLSLHNNGVNKYMFVNGVAIYKFKAENFETNADLLCLATVSRDFSADNMKKNGLYGYVYDLLCAIMC